VSAGRQEDFQTTEGVDAVGAGSECNVSEHIIQIAEDSHLEALLTDDVCNLSVRFQRVKVTGEDISGVESLLFFLLRLPHAILHARIIHAWTGPRGAGLPFECNQIF